MPFTRQSKTTVHVVSYVIALGVLVLFVSGLLMASPLINTGTATSVLLLSVLVVARTRGTRPALVTAAGATAAYSFYFLPPAGFAIENPNDWVAFGAFVITAIVAGRLWATAERRRLEIERLYQELQASFVRASEAEAERRTEQLKATLLDALTHNLRTPLTAIKAAVTALIEPDVSHLDQVGQRELIAVINEESDRLNRYIGGLVPSGAEDGDRTPGSVRTSPISEIIDAALARAAPIAREHHVELVPPNDLPPVSVDAAAVTEVIYILLDNAVKYSPRGTTIKVTTEQPDPRTVAIIVADQGPGIPVELRERVFEKFYRIPSISAPPGSGLGLSIARRLAEMQGARIWIEGAQRGHGTRVIIALGVSPARSEGSDTEWGDGGLSSMKTTG
jgi:K+-sensing histidine kinase KdpD